MISHSMNDAISRGSESEARIGSSVSGVDQTGNLATGLHARVMRTGGGTLASAIQVGARAVARELRERARGRTSHATAGGADV